MAAADERPRLVDREAEVRGEAGLADLLHEEPVTRQYPTDRLEVLDVRRHLLDRARGLLLHRLELVPARGAHVTALAETVEQRLSRDRRVGHDRDVRLKPVDLLRVDVDVDDRRPVARRRPAEPLQLEAGAEAEDDVRLVPTPEAGGAREAEVVVVADDPSPAPEGHDRRLQELRQLAHLPHGTHRSPSDHDHRVAGRREQLDRLVDRGRIRAVHHVGVRDRLEDDRLVLLHHVPRHLDRDWTRAAGRRLHGTPPRRAPGRRQDGRSSRPTSSASAASPAGPAARADAPCPHRCTPTESPR